MKLNCGQFVAYVYDLCTGVLVRRLRRKYLLDALSAHNTSSGFCITTKNKLHIRNFTCRNKNAAQHKKAVNIYTAVKLQSQKQ